MNKLKKNVSFRSLFARRGLLAVSGYCRVIRADVGSRITIPLNTCKRKYMMDYRYD